MPDHDPDRLRKFRRDRINEPGLVRLGTDRQTTTTTARLSPLSPQLCPPQSHHPPPQGWMSHPRMGGTPQTPPPTNAQPLLRQNTFRAFPLRQNTCHSECRFSLPQSPRFARGLINCFTSKKYPLKMYSVVFIKTIK